ncbi:hypothetical protein CPC08DRAFT_740771 [Agrocybe pediades]|nr:hypothetical protein CPC08DRAFT_740771 [Agrocybe pediades]
MDIFEAIYIGVLEDDIADEEREEHSRLAILAAGAIILESLENRRLRSARRQRLYLVRPDLLPNPRAGTPWQRLLARNNDRAFITTMGIDVETFQYLLDSGFARAWETTPIPRPDQPMTAAPRNSRRSLDAAGALGLVLHWLSSTMHDVSLMQIFALIPSTVSRYIKFSLSILLQVLRTIPEGRIVWPEGDEFQANNDLVLARHPLLTGAFGTMDGLNLMVQESADEDMENATFNGWLHEHFVSSVFAFGASGVIIACRLNAPGSWHDARVARPIYEKLRTATPEGYYLVTDTAFPRGTDQIAGRIQAPMKSGTRLPEDPGERSEVMARDRQLLSYRQTAEWGMRGLQGSFGRLRVPLEINHADLRADLLETSARMFQVRTRRVGINQIRTVYMPTWMDDDDQRSIWNDFENILFRDQRRLDRVARYHLIEYDE